MRMWLKLKLLWLLPILSVLNGCATGLTVAGKPQIVSDYCRIAKPITYDTIKDTQDTVQQVEAHNSQWVAVCEGK